MQKRFMNKRGISPLIATVILVGATVALFVIIYALVRGVVVGQVEKVNCAEQEQISLDINPSCKTDSSSSPGSLNVELSNNGQIKIDGAMIVVHCTAGNSVGFPAGVFSGCNPGEVCKLPLYGIPNECSGGSIEKVEVIPGVIKGTGKVKKFTACIDKLKEATCTA